MPDYLDEMDTVDSFDVDKAWDAMHRALCGSELEFGNDPAPGCWVVLGGEVLRGDREEEDDYLVILKTPEQVREALEARERQKAGPTAPAQGLCLLSVDYD